jgi:manganese-transporting P-type ATPase
MKEVPLHYREAYSHYTKQGYRLLALASKEVPYDYFKDVKNRDEERRMAENDLQFVGFFICTSPLKEDTKRQIEGLQRADYRILIITGDNILTAAKVALTLDFGTIVWTLERDGDKTILED